MSLARATGLTDEEFVSRMNSLGQEIGLRETTFIEPTGLDANNISPASDVALLVKQALGSKTISEIARLERYEFDALTGLRHVISSTDDLLGSSISKPPYTFMGGKTGYIIEADYCFAAAAENGQGNRVIAVVLGAPSKEVRFAEVSSLLYWAFDAFMWD
jgi:D-alanyl-D-alanine endopeptidase (penicillin-binding protein 7)